LKIPSFPRRGFNRSRESGTQRLCCGIESHWVTAFGDDGKNPRRECKRERLRAAIKRSGRERLETSRRSRERGEPSAFAAASRVTGPRVRGDDGKKLRFGGNYPNVNANACTPGSRNSISNVRSVILPFVRTS
jgi:hypothetical protein